MKNNCYKIEKLMALYLYDELSEKDRAALETHVNTCPACAAKLAQFRHTYSFITEKQLPTPTPDWDESWWAIRKRLMENQQQHERKKRVYLPTLKWVGALAGAMAIFFIGLLLGLHLKDTNAGQKIPETAAADFLAREFQDHIESIKPVIIEYANYWRSTEKPLDLPVEKERVIDLLIRNQQMLCHLPGDNNRYMQQLLNELNGILTKILLLSWDDPESLALIKKTIRKKGLLFKMEALRPTKEIGTTL